MTVADPELPDWEKKPTEEEQAELNKIDDNDIEHDGEVEGEEDED